jgi:cellulose synthase/poly-beta-1,6-N-acetylglucosamine synthase-like glycosyltransferase
MITIFFGTKNEERYIEKCLESFINQDYPKEGYEIIIAMHGTSASMQRKGISSSCSVAMRQHLLISSGRAWTVGTGTPRR